MNGPSLTADDAKQLLRLFGGYVHTAECNYVQKPNGECTCERAPLYAKVRELANSSSN